MTCRKIIWFPNKHAHNYELRERTRTDKRRVSGFWPGNSTLNWNTTNRDFKTDIADFICSPCRYFYPQLLKHVLKKGFYSGGVLRYRNTGCVFKCTTDTKFLPAFTWKTLHRHWLSSSSKNIGITAGNRIRSLLLPAQRSHHSIVHSSSAWFLTQPKECISAGSCISPASDIIDINLPVL